MCTGHVLPAAVQVSLSVHRILEANDKWPGDRAIIPSVHSLEIFTRDLALYTLLQSRCHSDIGLLSPYGSCLDFFSRLFLFILKYIFFIPISQTSILFFMLLSFCSYFVRFLFIYIFLFVIVLHIFLLAFIFIWFLARSWRRKCMCVEVLLSLALCEIRTLSLLLWRTCRFSACLVWWKLTI